MHAFPFLWVASVVAFNGVLNSQLIRLMVCQLLHPKDERCAKIAANLNFSKKKNSIKNHTVLKSRRGYRSNVYFQLKDINL